MRVLHVEADLAFARRVRDLLAVDGVVTDWVSSVSEARPLLTTGAYAALVLELRLPDGDGAELVHQLRAARRPTPVLVVSGLCGEHTMIRLLEAGADDYMPKPVSLDLLRARFRALVRRGGARDGEVLRVGDLVVDRGRREARVGETPLMLSTLEFNLLAHLAARPGQVQTRAVLRTAVWSHHGSDGERDAAVSNVVDVTVGRVRRRLAASPDGPIIDAVRGVGYVLRSPALPAAWTPREFVSVARA